MNIEALLEELNNLQEGAEHRARTALEELQNSARWGQENPDALIRTHGWSGQSEGLLKAMGVINRHRAARIKEMEEA